MLSGNSYCKKNTVEHILLVVVHSSRHVFLSASDCFIDSQVGQVVLCLNDMKNLNDVIEHNIGFFAYHVEYKKHELHS